MENADAVGAAHNDPDEVRVEEQRAYAARVGRWSREALTAMRDSLLWTVLTIMRVCHMPLRHHQAWMEQKQNTDALSTHGDK
eukprot:8026054-Alexandrium_andersonii.AAC.1